MKKLILAASFLFAGSAFANTGAVVVNGDDATIRQTVSRINSGHGYFNDNCSGRRKVYAVEFTNGGYRVDKYGNLQETGGKAVVKYRCSGSGN